MLLKIIKLTRGLEGSGIELAVENHHQLYQYFRERELPYGLHDSLCTLHLFCSLENNSLFSKLRTGATLDTGGWLVLSRQGLSPC